MYSCKDTTGKSGDEDGMNSTASRRKKRKFVDFALQLELSTMSEISELILLLNKQHQEQMAVFRGEHQEQMAVLRDEHREQNKQHLPKKTTTKKYIRTY